MALKDLGINYKRKMREDNMMDEIGFCIKKNRHIKYIGVSISGFRMINLKDWSYHKIGKTVMLYLHKKKFVKYIKAVYVDYGLPRSSGDIEEKLKQILQGIDKNCTENIQAFTHCPPCNMIGTLCSQQLKTTPQINILCQNCLIDFIPT